MFKKINRIGRLAVKELFRRGRKRVQGGALFVFRENNLSYPRLAVIISSKTVKSAVKRNKMKRELRRVFGEVLKGKEKVGGDFAVVIRDSDYSLKSSKKEIESAVESFVKSIKIN